jgi:hypothetical protein
MERRRARMNPNPASPREERVIPCGGARGWGSKRGFLTETARRAAPLVGNLEGGGGGVTTEAVGTGGGGVCCTGRVNPKGKRGRRAVRSLYREWPENRGDLIYSVIDHVDAKFRNCPWGSGVTAPCLVTDGRGP